MNALTFESLPKAVTDLQETVNNIERLLLEKSNNITQPEVEELLTVSDAAKFLSLSVPTIYGLIHKGQLPMMKRSKRCYFLRVDLLNYLKEGRKKTIAESAFEANAYLARTNRGVSL